MSQVQEPCRETTWSGTGLGQYMGSNDSPGNDHFVVLYEEGGEF